MQLTKTANASMFVDMVFKLKNKTGHGHDDMPTKLLKERISIIIHPITYSINISLEKKVKIMYSGNCMTHVEL